MIDSAERKSRFADLLNKYSEFKSQGKLDLTTEETIRSWLYELLIIFDWDVKDTSQVLQEKPLSKEEQKLLKEIDSTNSIPDYTLKFGKEKLTFLDAKDISVNIKKSKTSAFQIKSYGWSINAPCAFISNFEEFAIYDCTYVPTKEQDPDLGRIYLQIHEYLDNYDIIEKHLLKTNVYSGDLKELYSASLKGNNLIEKKSPDLKFAEILSSFRIALAKQIKLENKELIENNSSFLSYLVQIIINRILFIRVCEARKIEIEGLLLKYKEKDFWNEFKNSSYMEFYNHYDGPLFERIKAVHEVKLENKIFDSILQNLYYPSPYRFDVIPTKLLSDIYEIFLSQKVIIDGDKVKVQLKSEYVKTKGAIGTPDYIVNKIIEETIPQSIISKNGIDGLLQTKILDLACGSGVFAIGVYDHLEKVLIDIYSRSKKTGYDKYFERTGTEILLNVEGKKAIIENCIFGVDIDPEAVEVTKMSLSLKVVDSTDHFVKYKELGLFGNKILEGVGMNIKCGNSLVGPDITAEFPDLLKNETELEKTNIFDWIHTDNFKEIFDSKKGFDFIVGNPPYVEVKNYNTDLPVMHAYLKNKFISSKNGKVDLAMPFIEKAIELLNKKGRLGFIVQKRFFGTEYGRKIRGLITSKNLIASIIDFVSTRIFRDRLTYVAIMVLDNNSPKTFNYSLYSGTPENLATDLREKKIAKELSIPSKALDENRWSFDEPQLLSLKRDLKNKLGTLGEYVKIKVGIQALWDKAYHIRPISDELDIIVGYNNLSNTIAVEKQACRPLICNENFYPYRSTDPDVYVIFPYDVKGKTVNEINFKKFKERFPLASNYLNSQKKLIRKNVETKDGDSWHLYTRVQNHSITNPKILIPMTAKDTFATVSFSEDIYCDNANVYFIDSPEKDEKSLYAISAIINSVVFSVLARSIANPQDEGYFKFNKQFLDPVPFPGLRLLGGNKAKETLAAAAKKIIVLQNKIPKSTPTQAKSIVISLNNLWSVIDDACYKLYELDSEAIKFFKAKGRNVNRIPKVPIAV